MVYLGRNTKKIGDKFCLVLDLDGKPTIVEFDTDKQATNELKKLIERPNVHWFDAHSDPTI